MKKRFFRKSPSRLDGHLRSLYEVFRECLRCLFRQRNREVDVLQTECPDCVELPSGEILRAYNARNVHERDFGIRPDDDGCYVADGCALRYVVDEVDQYFAPFDAVAMSEALARRTGRNAARIREKWEWENRAARKVGRFMHTQLQNVLMQRRVKCEYHDYFKGVFSVVQTSYVIIKELNQFEDFRQDFPFTPYRTCWMIYDKPSQLVNMVDMLCVDQGGEYVIVDWKRSRKFGEESNGAYVVPGLNVEVQYRGLDALSHVADTPYWRAALSVSVSRLILRRNYKINVLRAYALVLHANNKDYHLVELLFMEAEAELILRNAASRNEAE